MCLEKVTGKLIATGGTLAVSGKVGPLLRPPYGELAVSIGVEHR